MRMETLKLSTNSSQVNRLTATKRIQTTQNIATLDTTANSITQSSYSNWSPWVLLLLVVSRRPFERPKKVRRLTWVVKPSRRLRWVIHIYSNVLFYQLWSLWRMMCHMLMMVLILVFLVTKEYDQIGIFRGVSYSRYDSHHVRDRGWEASSVKVWRKRREGGDFGTAWVGLWRWSRRQLCQWMCRVVQVATWYR